MENEIEGMENTGDSVEKEVKKSKKKDKDIASILEGRFIVIKVGNDQRPATDEDIEEIEKKFGELMKMDNINCSVFVTHHAIQVEVI
jgi:hypothetical protein